MYVQHENIAMDLTRLVLQVSLSFKFSDVSTLDLEVAKLSLLVEIVNLSFIQQRR